MRLPLAAAAVLAAGAAAAQSPVVSGEAGYRARIAAPPGLAFEATLADVSRADAPATVIGRARIEDAGQPPYRFAIPYDPAVIDPAATYAVRATLTHGGRLWATSDTHTPALTRGAGDSVTLTMVLVAQPAETAPTLLGARWRVEAWGEQTAQDDGRAEIVFGEDGRLSGSAGCNRLLGGYVARADGAFLADDRMAMTMMACPEAAMAQERGVTAALRAARTWRIEGDRLILGAEGAPLLTFRRIAE